MSNTLEKISRFYDQETFQYDTGYDAPICRAEDRVTQDYLNPLTTGKEVIDVGSGSGLGRSLVDSKKYLGVEISHQMSRQAKAKFPNDLFVDGDQHALPVPDNSFDALISLYGPFSYSLAPELLLAEYRRVVRPGGNLAIMPYTQRVNKNLEVGGYSTAVHPEIEKIFYNTQLLQEVFAGFSDLNIIGINYYGNTLVEHAQVLGVEITFEMLVHILRQEQPSILDVGLARHCLVICTNNK